VRKETGLERSELGDEELHEMFGLIDECAGRFHLEIGPY
jgi:hypothetical protein